MNLAYEKLGRRPSLDMMLLARHAALDHLVAGAVERGEVRQVVEVAAGLSPRGFRMATRYREAGLRYVEADLPEMAATKRRLLDEAGLRGPNHEVVPLDALADEGPVALATLVSERLDPTRGTAILTEGLLGYFDRATVEALWRRFATVLGRFPVGLYLSDLNLAGDLEGMRAARAFRALLSAFARGKVHLHYETAEEAEKALRGAGFREATLHRPTDFPELDFPGRDRHHVVRIVVAHA